MKIPLKSISLICATVILTTLIIFLFAPVLDDRDLPRQGTEILVTSLLPSALENLKIRVGDYPICDGRLDELLFSADYFWGEELGNFDGKDGWGNGIYYRYPTDTNEAFLLISFGEDGITSDDDIIFKGGTPK